MMNVLPPLVTHYMTHIKEEHVMAKKILGECFLEFHITEDGEESREKRIELSPDEAQLLFEMIQNRRNNGVDEDIEEIFS
jgi:hypothetical protein